MVWKVVWLGVGTVTGSLEAGQITGLYEYAGDVCAVYFDLFDIIFTDLRQKSAIRQHDLGLSLSLVKPG